MNISSKGYTNIVTTLLSTYPHLGSIVSINNNMSSIYLNL